MVTIEEKLSMFSKLLQRTKNEKFVAEMAGLAKEYEAKLRDNKDNTDREAESIKKKLHKKAETEKTEILSKGAAEAKKEYLLVKDELYARLLSKLIEEMEKFATSDGYEEYFISLLKRLSEIEQPSDNLIVYLTDRDKDKFEKIILTELNGGSDRKVEIKNAAGSIIGGFISINPTTNTRLDFSIKTLIEDNKMDIMQVLFLAIEGDLYGK